MLKSPNNTQLASCREVYKRSKETDGELGGDKKAYMNFVWI